MLAEVSQAVNKTLDLETVLSTIAAKAVQLSNTDVGAIYVFDDAQRLFRLRATYGMDRKLIDALTHQRIGLDGVDVPPPLTRGELFQVADLREEPATPLNQIILAAGYRALLALGRWRRDRAFDRGGGAPDAWRRHCRCSGDPPKNARFVHAELRRSGQHFRSAVSPGGTERAPVRQCSSTHARTGEIHRDVAA